ncbi:uncharacterized protein LOC142791435 [Rhipicephalus microplus]|uniref:uncharacterized protein LOC142791435 n=1 Tax=Rhipicephalus microplus TaxID=6941 RepID=UPI003F6AF5D1
MAKTVVASTLINKDNRVLAVCAQPYDGGIIRAPGDFYDDRPGGLTRGGGLEREFASGLERESVGGYGGGYRNRGPQRFPASASESYPGRRPGRLPNRDVYPGGLPGGTSPTLCGVFKHCNGKGTYRYTIDCPSHRRNWSHMPRRKPVCVATEQLCEETMPSYQDMCFLGHIRFNGPDK